MGQLGSRNPALSRTNFFFFSIVLTPAWYPKTLYPLLFLQNWAHMDTKGSKNIYSFQGTRI